MKILAVDDISQNLTAIEEVLAKRGHRVSLAVDGQDALDLIIGGLEFDLLITDQNMPRLTGAGLVKRLRQMGYGQPMLILTSLPSSVPDGAGQDAVYDKRHFFRMLDEWGL